MVVPISGWVLPVALVIVPGPLRVEKGALRIVAALEKLVVKLAVLPKSESVPAPVMEPADWLKAPEPKVSVREAAMLRVPVLVKEPDAPPRVALRSAPVTLMVPLLV